MEYVELEHIEVILGHLLLKLIRNIKRNDEM